MCDKMLDRLAADRRADTLAMANAVGIGFGGDAAYKSWLKAQGESTVSPQDEAALKQSGTIMRMQSLFARQSSPALRNAIRVKKPD